MSTADNPPKMLRRSSKSQDYEESHDEDSGSASQSSRRSSFSSVGGRRTSRERFDALAPDPRLSVEFEIKRQGIEEELQTHYSSRKEARDHLSQAPDSATVKKVEKKASRCCGPCRKADLEETVEVPDFHAITFDDLYERLELRAPASGLKQTEASLRLRTNGPNVIQPYTQSTILKILGYLISGFNLMLFGASILAWLAWKPAGEPNPDPINIALAVILIIVALISALFNWYQAHKSSQVMSSIKKLLPASALVLRDGAPHIHPVTQLVTGDVVLLNSGERVPADIRLIESHGMKIDQAALTGESEPVSSSINCTDANYLQTKNIIFFGTNILEGSGRGVVVTTGNSTVMGQIASSASRPSTNTAKMTTEIRRVIIIIAVLAGATSLAIILSWVFWLRVQYPGFMSLSQLIVTIIGVVVGFLPSGLPVCVTLSLTVIAKKMAQNHVVVKHLPTVEALGSVDVIASDKTGTLTQNKMSVVHIVTAPVRKIDCSISDKAFVSLLKDKDPIMTKLVQVLGLCNNARFEAIADDAKNVESTTGATPNAAANAAADAPRKIIGDASDTAILRFAATYLDVEAERTKWKKLFEVPFNSKNKWMLSIHGIPLDTPVANISDTTAAIPLVSSKKAHVVIEDSSSSSSSSSSSTTNDNIYQYNEKKALLLMKGAAEMMVARCTSYLDVDGKLRAITDTFKAKIAKEQSKLGANGERVLGVCFREFEVTREFPVYDAAFDEDKDLYEVPHLDDLCFIGLVALMDPPRAEVLPAIEALHNAFVKVMMVTGDHPSTAQAIARMVGIVHSENVDYVSSDNIEKLRVKYPIHSIIAKSPFARKSEKKQARANAGMNEVELSVSVDTEESEKHDQHALVITGTEISHFTEAMWDWVLVHDEIVFARTTPEDKLTIVTELQNRGHTVGVTGDGVNDAPALKKAECGVAMGAGSEVSKEAADLVLTDNDFSSILVGIKYGRLVFDNLIKVMLFLFPSGSWCEIIPVILNVFFGLPIPLSAFLMIYIACFTDMGPGLALIKETAEKDVMLRRPRKKTSHLVGPSTFIHAYLYIGLFESFGALTMYFLYMWNYAGFSLSSLFFAFDKYSAGFGGRTQGELTEILYTAQCVYFVAVVVIQAGNTLGTRTQYLSLFQHNPLRGPGRNWYLFLAISISVALAAIVVYIPPLNTALGTRPIPFEFWFLPLGWTVGLILLDELRKLAVRRIRKTRGM